FHQGRCFFGQGSVVARLRAEHGGLKPALIEQPMNAAKLVNQLLVELFSFRNGRVNASWHLALSQKFVKFPVLVGGAAKMSHGFRPDGALRRSNELHIILHGTLEHEAHGLAVFCRHFGKFGVEFLVDFWTDLYSSALGHSHPSAEEYSIIILYRI